MASYLCYMAGKLGKYPLEVCLAYDHQFRQYLARYSQIKWETPNTQLEGATFYAAAQSIAQPSPAQWAPMQSAPAQWTPIQSAPAQPAPARSAPTASTPEVCRKYNEGRCQSPCKAGRLHHCTICKGSHTAQEHSTVQPPKKGRVGVDAIYLPCALHYPYSRR